MKPHGLLMIASAFALVGCGGAEVTKVSGTVLANGEPVENVCVTFWPKIDLNLGMIYAPETAEDGSFETHPNPERGQGRAGTYAVMITDNRYSGMAVLFSPDVFVRVHEKYWDAKTTPLEQKLDRGQNDLGMIEIERGTLRHFKLNKR